jgi:hypothetical protein
LVIGKAMATAEANGMARGSDNEGVADELGYRAWLLFWGELFVLAALVVLGALFASADRAPGDYGCGLILSLATIALAFMLVKARFDGIVGDWGGFLLVDDMANLVAAIVVFTVLALAGLFIAAGFEYGGLHDAGVALFVASGLAVFFHMKRVFDNSDRRR